MNLKNQILLMTGLFTLLFISCNDDEYGPRKESTPVIESAAVTPATFTFGDSIMLTAMITEPATNLSGLAYEIVSDNRTLASDVIPIGGTSHDVAQAIFVPLLSGQADNAEVQVNLIARNVLKGTASHQITGLTGKRPVYNLLYLVTDGGSVTTLTPLPGDKNRFHADGLTYDTSFSYRIAEKLNADNSIDYSGDVYGNVGGKIGLIGESGESAFAYAASADYTKEFLFDSYTFSVSTTGSTLGPDDLALSRFSSSDIGGELFRVLDTTLEKGKSYSLFGDLANARNLYNPDFFERTAANKVTFLGETGEYAIYYNPVRRNIFVGVDNPAYPDYLLVCGWGLGYPTHVTSAEIAAVYPGKGRTHTDWGFGNVLSYVLMRRIDENVFQGTFYTPGDHDHYAGFKPFENTGWGNEKQAGNFTFTGEQIIQGDNNWDIPNGENDPVVESANYRFTINLNNNTVHIEKVTL
ncbi:MAG TPA: hypothetical protein DEQ06_08790 [Porphyromonadaceae bacterium]|nr:hypothetical protein [Porphyromonadaceae bacterium]